MSSWKVLPLFLIPNVILVNSNGVVMAVLGSVVDPKLFFSDPTFQEISDPDPT